MDVAALRAEMPALANTVYLNAGGYAPCPRRVSEASFEAYRYLQENGPDVQPVIRHVREQAEASRQGLASLLGVTPDEIAFTRAVSEGINIVGWGLPWQPGDEVIISDQEHPSGRLPWYNLRDRLGIVVREVPVTADPGRFLERLEAAITPRTRLVAVSHVTAENGLRLAAKDVCDVAHTRGAQVLLDAAQAVGQFPIDLRAIGVDYYATTGHKWLLAGPGVGALYVRGERLDRLAVTWAGQGGVEYGKAELASLPWWDSARRFEFGGRNWASYVGYGVAVDLIRELTPAAIEARVAPMASRLKRDLAAIPGVSVLTPDEPDQTAGIVACEVAGRKGTEIAAALWERFRIVCRAALGGRAVRISVAFFTTEDELAHLGDAVRDLVSEPVR